MKEVKRSIELVGTEHVLVLSIANDMKTKNNMIHLDQLEDGTWMLTWNSNMIPDFTKINEFKIIREN